MPTRAASLVTAVYAAAIVLAWKVVTSLSFSHFPAGVRMSASVEGELFIYSPLKRLAAFRSRGGKGSPSGASEPTVTHTNRRRKHAVFVPGLTNGLLALDYVPPLAAALDTLGYSLVQPVLSSSYKGYGTSSLRQDVEELDELLAYLCCPVSTDGSSCDPRPPSQEKADSKEDIVVLIGHSTGCQDAVFYMKHGRADLRGKVRGVVLQAPVSDHQYMATLPETERFIAEARAKGGGKELMSAEANEAPITAARYLSLATKEGDDDMFSSDLSDDEIHFRLGHMVSVPTAALLSGADEFVPRKGPSAAALAEMFRKVLLASSQSRYDANQELEQRQDGQERHQERIDHHHRCASKTEVHVIDGANHALSQETHAEEFIEKVVHFISSLE